MLQIVKCPICEKIANTTGKWTFRCCNREFLIEKCRIVDNSLFGTRPEKKVEELRSSNKEEKQPRMIKVIPNPEPKMVKVKILKAGIDYPKKLTFDDVD